MPQTVQCQSCGIILNLPDKVAAGKRLRCPKCGLRFVVTVADASSESTVAGHADADPAVSGFEIPKRPRELDELPLPTAEGDLRETFELPLMNARDAERSGASEGPATSDAAALFEDNPRSRRKLTAAEARAKARRCVNCGGVVPQGMSICASCGVDQETGLRIGLDDDLAPPPPPRAAGPPLHVAIIGALVGTSSLILLIVSLARSVGGAEAWQNYGWLCLAVISGFAIFAAVQFIRGKSAKLLMAALTLGVVIDLMTLIAMPLILANFVDPDQIVTTVHSDDPQDSGVKIKPFEERLDTRSLSLGVTFLVLYAVLSVYLMSPAVKKYFHSRPEGPGW